MPDEPGAEQSVGTTPPTCVSPDPDLAELEPELEEPEADAIVAEQEQTRRVAASAQSILQSSTKSDDCARCESRSLKKCNCNQTNPLLTHAGNSQLPDPILEDCPPSVEPKLDEQMCVEPGPHYYQELDYNPVESELSVLITEQQVIRNGSLISRGENIAVVKAQTDDSIEPKLKCKQNAPKSTPTPITKKLKSAKTSTPNGGLGGGGDKGGRGVRPNQTKRKKPIFDAKNVNKEAFSNFFDRGPRSKLKLDLERGGKNEQKFAQSEGGMGNQIKMRTENVLIFAKKKMVECSRTLETKISEIGQPLAGRKRKLSVEGMGEEFSPKREEMKRRKQLGRGEEDENGEQEENMTDREAKSVENDDFCASQSTASYFDLHLVASGQEGN